MSAYTPYRQAVEVDATDPAAALSLGRYLLRARRNSTEALPLLRRACQDRLGWAEALVAHGEALLGLARPGEALEVYQEAVRIAPTQPGAQTWLGRSLVGAGRWQEAEAPLREGIRQGANDAPAHVALAEVLEHTGRESQAMEVWDAAIDRAPADMSSRLRAAQLAQRTQQNSLARAYLDRVLQAEPRRAEALLLRGIIAAEGATARKPARPSRRPSRAKAPSIAPTWRGAWRRSTSRSGRGAGESREGGLTRGRRGENLWPDLRDGCFARGKEPR